MSNVFAPNRSYLCADAVDPRTKLAAPNLSTLAGLCRFCCLLPEECGHSLAGVWDLLKALGVERSKFKTLSRRKKPQKPSAGNFRIASSVYMNGILPF